MVKSLHWRPSNLGRLLPCRPRGGLNDTLCQIELCREYCLRNNRDLWVDTYWSGLHDCLSTYFERSDFHFGAPSDDLIGNGSFVPGCIKGKLHTYDSAYNRDLHNFVDTASGTLLSFDFSRRYQETLLLHEQCGERNPIDLFSRLRFKRELRRHLQHEIQKLGRYDAIHARNT